MEEKKNIAITLQEAREWYESNNPTLSELALKTFTKEELESKLPRTWEEYCNMHSKKGTLCFYIRPDSDIATHYHHIGCYEINRNLCRTAEDAEAFRALMQLRALWHDYVGNFKFDWKHGNTYCGIILDETYNFHITVRLLPRSFCFPTKELAEKFLTNFKDLLKIAKPLFC